MTSSEDITMYSLEDDECNALFITQTPRDESNKVDLNVESG